MHRRRQWQPTPVFLPGKSHGRRSLVGFSPGGREELDMTEQLHFHFSLSCIGEGNGNPLQCSCLENPRDGRAWRAAICGVAQSWTWLKRLSSSSSSHPYMTTGKTIALTRRTFVAKVMSLLFNMLSRLVIPFLPRSKRLLISWPQSPSAVILEPQKIKSDTVFTIPIYFPWSDGTRCHDLSFLNVELSVLIKETPENSPSLLLPCEAIVKRGTRKQALTRHQICWCLDPRLLSLQNYEK